MTSTPLTLQEYQSRALASNQFRGKDTALDQLRFGLFGEVGTVLALVKKSYRDLHAADISTIEEELGDALWYLTTASVECASSLQNVGHEALGEIQEHLRVVAIQPLNEQLTFKEFDGLVSFSRNSIEDEGILRRLSRLGMDCGHLLGETTEDLASRSSTKILSSILADLVLVGALFNVEFEKIAKRNLTKIESRWPPETVSYTPLFDEGRKRLEKFPRVFSMRFLEITSEGKKPYVIQQMKEISIGDRLTDNRHEPDGYRFHDVFHLAYLAHLGWSPVIRALLKLKRKTDPETDENEDGARAIIIEEGIATWIFNYAKKRSYFEGVEKGKLDYNLLKQVSDMVQGYEVEKCPMWQWERAILDGFSVFRELLRHSGGVVKIDLNERTIKFDAALPTDDE